MRCCGSVPNTGGGCELEPRSLREMCQVHIRGYTRRLTGAMMLMMMLMMMMMMNDDDDDDE